VRKLLNARGDIHAVAVNVTAFDNDVADIHANPEFNACFSPSGMFAKHLLQCDCAVDRIDDAEKLDKRTITHQLDHTTLVLCNLRLEDSRAQIL